MDEWRQWLQDVHQEIVELHNNRALWREIVELLRSVTTIPDPGPEPFLAWLTRFYVVNQVMGIRRQADKDKQTLSLARLLETIVSRADELRRDEFVASWVGHYADQEEWFRDEIAKDANRTFDEFAGGNNDSVDPNIIQSDIDKLIETSAQIKQYADKHVAHHDKKPLEDQPTFGALDAALEQLGDLLKRYTLLIEGASLLKVEPAIQGDWLAPLRPLLD